MKRVKSADFAVLWDLDGTLVDTVELHVWAFIEALRILGYPVREEYARMYRSKVGERFDSIVREIFPEISESEIERMKDIRLRLLISRLDLLKVLPPARLLSKVSELCYTALVTSSSRPFAEAVIEHFGWSQYFDAIVTGDDVHEGKPSPEPVLCALRKLGVSRAVFIGDTDYDRLSAERAGVLFLPAERADEVLRICSTYTLSGTRR